MLAELRELFDYNRWATSRLLDCCHPLTHEEFVRPMGGSFASLRDTLVHAMGAEWIWLQRWNGASPPGFPVGWDVETVAAVEARWQALWTEQAEFLAGLHDADTAALVRYHNVAGTTFEAPLWQLMRHVVNHATYHRGQVTLLLRQLGHEAIGTDLVLYHREHQAPPAS